MGLTVIHTNRLVTQHTVLTAQLISKLAILHIARQETPINKSATHPTALMERHPSKLAT